MYFVDVFRLSARQNSRIHTNSSVELNDSAALEQMETWNEAKDI
jgi:hypothetical protein